MSNEILLHHEKAERKNDVEGSNLSSVCSVRESRMATLQEMQNASKAFRFTRENPFEIVSGENVIRDNRPLIAQKVDDSPIDQALKPGSLIHDHHKSSERSDQLGPNEQAWAQASLKHGALMVKFPPGWDPRKHMNEQYGTLRLEPIPGQHSDYNALINAHVDRYGNLVGTPVHIGPDGKTIDKVYPDSVAFRNHFPDKTDK